MNKKALLNLFNVAVYIRLSREDGDKEESDSVGNQRKLLTEYMNKKDDLFLYDFYVDDRYTGTSFERPAMQEMLDLVMTQQINCIMVKDFSRFGRNIIETGYFLEQVFPLYHVRFISVSEDFDSQKDTNSISVVMQFLRNEYYSQDLSRKTKSAVYARMKQGKYISKNCCYGYKKEKIIP